MTVTELRELLEELEGEGHGKKKAMFSYNYGDHWYTTVACEVNSAEEGTVKYSDYHQMYKVVDECDPEDGSFIADPAHTNVVILS